MTATELAGIAHELKFWQGFVKTKRFLKGWVGNCRTPELPERVAQFVAGHLPPPRVLDVGSGVVSILHGSVSDVTALDPLGELYGLVFDYEKYGIAPPLPIPGEEIPFKEEFDIVHMSNALDHSQSPGDVFSGMLAACKPGGYIIIQGFENEADAEKWQGFHRWNMTLNGDNLRLSGQADVHDVIPPIPVMSYSNTLPNGRNWITWICQKRS